MGWGGVWKTAQPRPLAIRAGGWEKRKDVAGETCHIQFMSSGSGAMCTAKSGGSWLPGPKVKLPAWSMRAAHFPMTG